MLYGRSNLVSVVIPCFRQGHLLSHALDSVFSQTYPAIETIVVNDGSDDETETVCLLYSNRVKYIYQANQGLSAARNTGVNAATGDYILFLDADDLLDPAAICHLVEKIVYYDRCISVMGWRDFQSLDSPLSSPPCYPQLHGSFLTSLVRANVAPVHCFLTPRRAIVDAGGFAESLRSHEDWDLWLRLALQDYQAVLVPYAGAFYRHSAGSMSSQLERMFATRIEVLERFSRLLLLDIPRLRKASDTLVENLCNHFQQACERPFATGYLKRIVNVLYVLAKALSHAELPRDPIKSIRTRFYGLAHYASSHGHSSCAFALFRSCTFLGCSQLDVLLQSLKIVPHKVSSLLRRRRDFAARLTS